MCIGCYTLGFVGVICQWTKHGEIHGASSARYEGRHSNFRWKSMYSIQLTCKVKECRSVLYAGKYEGMRYVLKPYKDMSFHSQLSLRIISFVASVWAKLRGRSMGQASAWATLKAMQVG